MNKKILIIILGIIIGYAVIQAANFIIDIGNEGYITPADGE